MLKSFGKAILVLSLFVLIIVAGFHLETRIMKWAAVIFFGSIAIAVTTFIFLNAMITPHLSKIIKSLQLLLYCRKR